MKILFLTSRFPYPLEKGDKLRAFHLIKHLSKRHEVVLAALNEKEIPGDHKEVPAAFCKKMFLFRQNTFSVFINLILALFKGIPFQVGYFYSQRIAKKISGIIRAEKPDLIFCHLIRMSEYVRHEKNTVKLIDYMDAFSIGMERWKDASAMLRKIPMQMEYKRLKRYEAGVFNDFNHHIIISEQDRNHIDHPFREKIHVIPNGVDYEYFKPMECEKKYDLLFAGNMNYPPNVESVLFIANEILPLVRRQKPGATLLIAGANPSAPIRKLHGNGIHVSGWMDDIREAFASSRIHLAPMLISIGLQNKILQAMAMKIPCVISALANNAIHAPGNCVAVGTTAEDYAEKILLLLQHKTRAQELAENAYGFVRENFDWGKAGKEIEKAIC